MYLLGNKADGILSSFQPNDEQSSNYKVKTRFDKYCSVKKMSFINELYLINDSRCQMNLLISLFYHCIVWWSIADLEHKKRR